ncbi:isopentenyl-diphosphate Delta-isomerase [Candidatus Peregrinibacteria bacterium]|nr:isopentenyl-diphosphate Delta-isomerase [Candidatus Peregrinibacteria bacterium]
MRNPLVTLVNENGKIIGTADRESAHSGKGKLHRAFSIFIFKKNDVLLQKRAPHKLFGSLWTNTCCSHPRPNETAIDAALRRLKEEFGFDCPLTECGSFIYRAHDKKGTEYEYDIVFVGEISDRTPVTPDTNEIAEWKWMNIEELKDDLKNNPEKYSPWLPQALKYASCDHS